MSNVGRPQGRSQREADQGYPKVPFPTKEENRDKMYLAVNIQDANSPYKIIFHMCLEKAITIFMNIRSTSVKDCTFPVY